MRRRSTTTRTTEEPTSETRRERDEFEGNPDNFGAAASQTETACPVVPPQETAPARSRLSAALDLKEKIDALKTPLDGVVERVFEIDFDDEYRRLESKLAIGNVNTASAAALNTALDESEENARAAHLLFVNAEYQREAFEIDAEILTADLRAQAVARLSGEKGSGARAKQITDADVRGMIAAIAPDEWRSLALRRKRLELTVEHLKRLADLWKNRCGTNETLVRSRR